MGLLVTGATGNVGSEVLRLLRDAGAPVRATSSRPRPAEPGIDWAVLDFKKPSTFAPALEGVTTVFLVRPPEMSKARELAPFLAVLKEANIERVVFLSLLGAERNKWVPHRGIEDAILALGIPYTFLRASFFMQNLSTTHAADIREHGEIIVPAGRGKTSFIDIRDIAAVAAKALTEPAHTNQAYDLTGGEALTYADAARVISEATGRSVVYESPPIWRFVRAMRARKEPWAFILVMIGICSVARFGGAARVTADTARTLGRPPITLAQFARDYRSSWAS